MNVNGGPLQFPSSSEMAKKLADAGVMTAENIDDIIDTPEFQILRIIIENRLIATEEIGKLYETQMLSLTLSNLQADGLIEQTNDYRWKITEYTNNLIAPQEASTPVSDSETIQFDKRQKKDFQASTKKSLYQSLSHALKHTSYIPTYYTVDDLYEIPELEILAIIFEYQPVETDEIEKVKQLDISVSLCLSNLQADNLIEQTSEYKWKITDQLSQQIVASQPSLDNQKEKKDPESSSVLSSEQAKVIEHKQLLKALLDIDYFQNKQVREVLNTPEFEILNIINSFSPVTTEEIEEMLQQDVPLSMLLSNLKADELIEQQNDYRWALNEEFNIMVSKVKVSQDEIISQIRREERLIREPVRNTSKPSKSNLKKKESQQKIHRSSEPKSSLKDEKYPKDPIIEALAKFGYIKSPNLSQSELSDIVEYNLLKLLQQNPPLTTEEMDTRIKTTSLSLILSNLSADGMVRQTNDYRYTLSPSYGGPSPQTQTRKEIPDITENNIKRDQQLPSKYDKAEKINEEYSAQKKEQFHQAVENYKLKEKLLKQPELQILERETEELEELLKIPEFEVLWNLSKYGPISELDLNEKCQSSSPIEVSQIISQYQITGLIIQIDQQKFSINFD